MLVALRFAASNFSAIQTLTTLAGRGTNLPLEHFGRDITVTGVTDLHLNHFFPNCRAIHNPDERQGSLAWPVEGRKRSRRTYAVRSLCRVFFKAR